MAMETQERIAEIQQRHHEWQLKQAEENRKVDAQLAEMKVDALKLANQHNDSIRSHNDTMRTANWLSVILAFLALVVSIISLIFTIKG